MNYTTIEEAARCLATTPVALRARCRRASRRRGKDVVAELGDGYIDQCGKGQVGTGNLTTWRSVGTNHHLTFVARQLASYRAPSNGLAPPTVGP